MHISAMQMHKAIKSEAESRERWYFNPLLLINKNDHDDDISVALSGDTETLIVTI